MLNKNKRYFWLQLKNNFFYQREIKKLRKIAGGDTYTIIYLKLMLISLIDVGNLYFEKTESTFSEQLALEIDEDINNVEVTLQYLLKNELLEKKGEEEFFLVQVPSLIGSETESARRVRKHREKQKALQCNTNETLLKQSCNTEIDIDKDIYIDTDIDIDKEIINLWNKQNNSQILHLNEERTSKLKNLIEKYTFEKVIKAIKNIKESDYLLKHIEFDWFLQEENFKKVYEGYYKKYENEKNKNSGFCNFEGRNYDYDALEKGLLGWDKDETKIEE